MAVRRLLSAVTAALVVLAMYGLPAPATEAGAEDGGIFSGIIESGSPPLTSIASADVPRMTSEPLPRSPWDHFGLQVLVGTLGAAGGGIAGALFGSVLCLSPDPNLCGFGILGGFAIGTLVAPVIAVDAVGRAYGVRGNIPLSFLTTVGGLVCGVVLDLRLGIPLLSVIGAGFGAALGYNIGATVIEQPPAGRQEKIQFAQLTIRW